MRVETQFTGGMQVDNVACDAIKGHVAEMLLRGACGCDVYDAGDRVGGAELIAGKIVWN